ncbi:MAG: hypothetical protein NT166_20325 [Candidatus Aminicenantes bacterium]|nr:hypothetical protein [Candidatus Aminicenantes bacterium]
MTDNTIGRLNDCFSRDIKKGFEKQCITTLIDGYKLMKEAGEFSLSWEEETLTANLIKYMKRSSFSSKWKLDITPECPIYTQQIYDGIRKPKEAPVIDVRIMNWSRSDKLEYFIEAKNLAENDWIKADGSKVNASHLRARYIDTGIDNFINERYPYGCLAGYVLEGCVDSIVNAISKLLTGKGRNRPQEVLTRNTPVNNHPDCYRSEHQTGNGKGIFLNHIFFKF